MSVGFIGAGQLAFALARGFTAAGRSCSQEGAEWERVCPLPFHRLGCEGGGLDNMPCLSPVGNRSPRMFGVHRGLKSHPGQWLFCSLSWECGRGRPRLA